jgi:hypothetical protein
MSRLGLEERALPVGQSLAACCPAREAGSGPGTGIGARLYLSEGTVKGHVSRLMTALGCDNRTQLALRAPRHGQP